MSNPPIPDAATPPLPHWEALARRWAQITPPLRPGPEDVAGYWRFAEAWIKRHGAPRVLLMGVTPELYQLPWPAGRTFLAVDRLKVMLDHIWPGRPDETLQADWAEMPLPPASYDLALCDAGMTLVDYPHGQRRVIDRLSEVLAPGGLCIMRFLVPAAEPETPAQVLADLLAGRIENLSSLKIRLGSALQVSPEQGVELGTIWQTLRTAGGDWISLAPRIGWSVEQLSLIDTYRDSTARYYFLSPDAIQRQFCRDGRFVLHGRYSPNYTLGDRCPVLVFEKT